MPLRDSASSSDFFSFFFSHHPLHFLLSCCPALLAAPHSSSHQGYQPIKPISPKDTISPHSSASLTTRSHRQRQKKPIGTIPLLSIASPFLTNIPPSSLTTLGRSPWEPLTALFMPPLPTAPLYKNRTLLYSSDTHHYYNQAGLDSNTLLTPTPFQVRSATPGSHEPQKLTMIPVLRQIPDFLLFMSNPALPLQETYCR